MKVFIVYEYNYDESCNHGAFSTEEKAKEYIKYLITRPGKYECNFEINIFELDKGVC